MSLKWEFRTIKCLDDARVKLKRNIKPHKQFDDA